MYPVLDRLREIVEKSKRSNHVVRYEDMCWIISHLYDIVTEIDDICEDNRVKHLDQ
jgi:hypothetical protein